MDLAYGVSRVNQLDADFHLLAAKKPDGCAIAVAKLNRLQCSSVRSCFSRVATQLSSSLRTSGRLARAAQIGRMRASARVPRSWGSLFGRRDGSRRMQ